MNTATTETATTRITITTRCRSLGYGWTNETEQHRVGAHSSLRVQAVTEVQVTGGLATVERERERAYRINGGNDWREMLFVGGKAVRGGRGVIGDALEELRRTGSTVVEVIA